jgi:hypothetical protein
LNGPYFALINIDDSARNEDFRQLREDAAVVFDSAWNFAIRFEAQDTLFTCPHWLLL